MVKEFLIEVLLLLTVVSGVITILAIAGWFWGAEDVKIVLLISGPVFVLCAIGVSFVRDGWKRILLEIFPF